MPAIETLDDLFHDGLKDIYYAEKEIMTTLDRSMKKIGSEELREALMVHRKETEQQIQRLEQVFQTIEQKARGKTCPSIQGIIAEGKEHMEEIEDEMVRDAAIIAAQQAIEHYEITRYGTLAEWARQLGNEEGAELLNQSLEEEKKTDALLNELARTVNEQADSGEDEDEEGMDADEEMEKSEKQPKRKPVKA